MYKILLIASALFLPVSSFAQTAKPDTTEVHQLKEQVATKDVDIAYANYTMANERAQMQLSILRAALEQAVVHAREVKGVPDTWNYDPTSHQFVAPATPKPATPPVPKTPEPQKKP